MTPPTRAVGSDASKSGRSFAQSTSFPRLNSQVEYVAATILSNNAVGRISCAANDENAITARKAVPPAWPTVAYSSETTPNSKASTVLALSGTLMEPLAWPVIAAVVTAAVGVRAGPRSDQAAGHVGVGGRTTSDRSWHGDVTWRCSPPGCLRLEFRPRL